MSGVSTVEVGGPGARPATAGTAAGAAPAGTPPNAVAPTAADQVRAQA